MGGVNNEAAYLQVYDEAFRLQTGGSVGRLIRGVERFVLSLGLSELRKWRVKGKKEMEEGVEGSQKRGI